MTPVGHRRGQWSPRSRRSAAIRPARRRLAAPGTLREFDQAIDDGGRPGASSEGKRAPSGRRALVGLESEPMDALGGAGRSERLAIQPPGKPMNAIAEAIADRQSEIERLQAEIKTLNDVDQMLVTSAPAKPAARRSSSRRPAAVPPPVPETASDAKPTRKRRQMTAKEKEAVSERMSAYWAERRKNAAK